MSWQDMWLVRECGLALETLQAIEVVPPPEQSLALVIALYDKSEEELLQYPTLSKVKVIEEGS